MQHAMSALPRKHLYAITAGVLLVSSLASMEATVVSTAVPTIVKALGGMEYYSWVFTAYMVTMTISVPVWGKLSDLYGRRPIYFTAILLFVVGSAMAGQADDMKELIGWRLLQGLGGGALTPVGQAILGDIFDLEERARIQGYLTAGFGVSSTLGPVVGGFVTEHASWRWVFYFNLPFAVAALFLLWGTLPRLEERTERPPLDILGAGLFACSFGILLLLLDQGQKWGWTAPLTLAGAAVFSVLFGGFVLTERRASDPLIDGALFKERMILGTLVISLLFGMALYGALIYLPLFYQGVLGKSAAVAGGALTPLLVSWIVVATFAPRLVLKLGYRPVIGSGAICLALSFYLLVSCDGSSALVEPILAACLLGLAGGLCFSPCMLGAQSVVEKERMGVASAAVTLFRNLGGALGVAVMGAALATALGSTDATTALGDPAMRLDLERGLDRAFWVGVVVSVLAAAAIPLLPRGTAEEISTEALERHRRAVCGLHAHDC
jgi:EmrB/QacA subfamily drug resistance transporter